MPYSPALKEVAQVLRDLIAWLERYHGTQGRAAKDSSVDDLRRLHKTISEWLNE